MIDIKKYYNPNRPIEPITKRDWKRKYPEFCISELPGPAIASKEDFETGYFDYADDNFIVHDYSDSKKMDLYWAWGFVGAFLMLITPGFFKMEMGADFLIMALIFSVITMLPALMFFIKAYYLNRERKLIFDRQRGLVQVPGSFLEPPQLIRFEDLHVALVLKTRFQGGFTCNCLKVKPLLINIWTAGLCCLLFLLKHCSRGVFGYGIWIGIGHYLQELL